MYIDKRILKYMYIITHKMNKKCTLCTKNSSRQNYKNCLFPQLIYGKIFQKEACFGKKITYKFNRKNN